MIGLLFSVAIGTTAAVSPQVTLVPKQAVVAEFGHCLVKNSERATRRLLVTEMGSADERRLAGQVSMAGRSCLKGRAGLTLMTGVVRGAIAEATFARDPQLVARARALSVADVARPASASGRAFVIAYATCLVRRTPQQSVALLEKPFASAEERAAFVAYGDELTRCMPMGQEYDVDITDVRNHIAAALYLEARSRTEADNA